MDRNFSFAAGNEHWLAFVSVLLLLVTFSWSQLSKRDLLKDFPVMGHELGSQEKRRKAFISNAKQFYNRGYEIFRNRAYRLTTVDGEHIVVPHSSLEELKSLPDDQISFLEASSRSNELKYTGLGGVMHSNFLLQAVRIGLTRNLNQINGRLSDEVFRTVPAELGDATDWKSVKIYSKLLRIVAIVSGNVFIGPEHCHDERYIHHAIDFTINLVAAIRQLKKWNRWLRWIGQYFTPELRGLHEHKQKAKDFLAPIIEERRKAMSSGNDTHDDILQWMLKNIGETDLKDEDIAEYQLNLGLAAIHTTTMTISLILYELVSRPELVEELRREIQEVQAKHNGIMTVTALFDMKLLDSVMKESQRTSPDRLVRFTRWVSKTTTLKDGTTLPAGFMIDAPHASILSDPAFYPNPNEFDPYRFYNLRTKTTKDPLNYKDLEQYQFVTVNKDFMAFGYGRHACPGRFFAANEIKLILARLLLDYDIKMPDGLTERYANLNMATISVADPTKSIMIRKI